MRYISPNWTLSVLVAASALCVCASCGGGGRSGSTAPPNNAMGQLASNPSSVSFGSVITGNSRSQTITLSNQGNGALSVNSASVTGPGFSVSGLTTPLTLAPSQSLMATIVFSPSTQGTVDGQLSLSNTGLTPPLKVALSGTGIGHSVDLSWIVSTSTVSGYNIWRAPSFAGPYAKINGALVVVTTYTDSAVMPGAVYYYAITAVDVNGVESAFSDQAQASIPVP